MAKQSAPLSLQALVLQLTQQLTTLVATEVERRVRDSIKPVRAKAPVASPVQDRLCPVPGCGKAGAGPRNRYFCSEHSRTLSSEEQRSIVARAKRLAGESTTQAAAPSGPRYVVVPPQARRAGRALDMSCRVAGCSNRSRGPRVGFICDSHRAELTPDEQAAARDQWNARKKAAGEPAPVVPVVVKAVPPIVRKPEPVAQAEEVGAQ